MGIYLNPGNDSFQSAVNSRIYVDKTEMLNYTNSVLDTEQRYICVSRPRRFGKSITANMITAYYDKSCDSKALFSPFKIAENPDFSKHMNQYGVIHLDIADMRSECESATDLVKYMQSCVIEELRKEYPEIADDSMKSLPSVLANINNVTGEKFILVIDEWDVLFREDKYDIKAQEEYINLLRGLFKGNRSKRFIKLAYLTGILPIKKYCNESALNNFDEYTMLQAGTLSEFIGFTSEEVKELCRKFDMDFEEMKRWYDGYCLEHDIHVYNPKSVVDAIMKKRYANYWTGTVAYESLKQYISMDFEGLKSKILEMLTGGKCPVEVAAYENDLTSFQTADDVLTVLIHLGYLSYDIEKKTVEIPNEEIRSTLESTIKGTNWAECPYKALSPR